MDFREIAARRRKELERELEREERKKETERQQKEAREVADLWRKFENQFGQLLTHVERAGFEFDGISTDGNTHITITSGGKTIGVRLQRASRDEKAHLWHCIENEVEFTIDKDLCVLIDEAFPLSEEEESKD